MLGLSSEKIIDEQIDALLGYLSRHFTNEFSQTQAELANIRIASANFTRITRNGLAHPSDTKMERIEVLMIFISFIKYCEIQYGFIDYYINH